MKIIFLSGPQGSGKTTLSTNLARYYDNEGISVETHKFAGVLYEMHDVIKAISDKYELDWGKTPIDGPLLQVLGTEWGRNKDANLWVNCLKSKLSKSTAEVVIIDDMRFPNELGLAQELKGSLTVRLEAGEAVRKERAEKWRPNTNHPSETGLDDYLSDFDLLIRTDVYDADETLDLVLQKANQCQC